MSIPDVFPDVPAADYLASILSDSRDALVGNLDAPMSAVLNACRVCAFVRERRICSKQEGGVWALAALPADIRTVIELALEQYADGPDAEAFDAVAVERFVAIVRRQLGL